jgi:RecB family endonuclease NucS
MARFISSPSNQEALEFAERYRNRKVLIIVGCCRVEYIGRAKSILDYGERLVIVKRDGSVLVHQSTGREPINWQPPNTKIEYGLKEDRFILSSQRLESNEKMRILFKRVDLISSFYLRDPGKIRIVGMESNIVDIILENSSVIEPGLRIVSREKPTRSGIIDIFAVDSNQVPVLIEVKRSQPGPSAVSQLEAYVHDFKRYNQEAEVRGILCAPKIPKMIRTLLAKKGLEWREFEPEFELADERQTTLDGYII